MDEYYSYQARSNQYSNPSFEKPASAQQNYPGYTGYLGNNGLDFQDPRRKEELRYLPHSQQSSDQAIKTWATKESDYPSDKDIVPYSINIKPCSRPLIDKEELNEVNTSPDQRHNINQKRGGGSSRAQREFLSPQYGDRKQQSNNYSNYGNRKQTDPKSASSKIREKDLPRSAEKKIIFNISPQTSHPTRDHISPDSIRYAKMSENEAAQKFEARRKALMDNLMKQTDGNSKDGSASEEIEEKRNQNASNKAVASHNDKRTQNTKKHTSYAAANKAKLRQAPVPMKSLGAELEKAKKRNKFINPKAEPKLTLNDEAISSIPSSAIPSSAITPHRQSFDSGENVPIKSKMIYKSLSPDKNLEKMQKRTTTQSSVVSPKLIKKKEANTKPKQDENTIELRKLFTQQPKSLIDQQVYSKAAQQETIYQADDEVYREREQGFVIPRSTVKKDSERSDREKVEHNARWSPVQRHAKGSEQLERARTENRDEKEKKDDIKSKFIRRKRKVSNEINDQENQTEDYHSDQEIREIKPYSSLNEKGFDSHHAYLHERALLQKRNRDIAHQQSKQQSKEKEIERCTFRPTIGSPPKYRESIIEKTKKWQIAREQQIVENQAAAVEKELNECTFYPNKMTTNLDNQYNFSDFLKRNSEWSQKRQEENKRKEEELFQKAHTSSIRSSHVRSPQREGIATKRLCCQEKEQAQTKPVSMKNSKSQKGLKAPQKQEIHHCQHTEEHEKHEKHIFSKPEERPTTVINELDAIQETQQDLKTTLQMATQQFEGIEDVPQVEEDISQSYCIIQNLKQFVTEKEEIKKSKENERKVNIDLLLRTTGERFLRESDSLERLHQHESNRKSRIALKSRGNSISPSRNQSSFFKEVPVTSLDYDSDLFQGNSCRVTLKNNKYYVSQKPELQSDIKNLVDFNSSPSAKVSDFLGEGDNLPKTKSILVQRNSRESSAKKTKTVTIYGDENSQKSPTHTSFRYVPSDVMINIEPQINQKYVEIINQASQVTSQIGQMGYQTYMSDWNN